MAEQSGGLTTKFVETYTQLTKHNLSELENLYHADVIFEDPAHKVIGWRNLHNYFIRLFRTVNECTFEVHDTLTDKDKAYIQWTMTFSHPRIASGEPRSVKGCSRLEYKENCVISHRDYFDMGEMIYEGVPVLGSVIRRIKVSL
ncbi:nuclear transport factor 2 family protein [Photobacterium chitinilyticum]|uniref:Nuclear transport factor 2 family protein n=2 Tax=Photobacterium chitinilyticum TaxID=2485123 RepID=A0A3S3QP17_9GAMM|nr:nuclear transport factor 2 family protein [Photobacterium chitinilyticum]RWX54935.1 nuclear transport factor 2 family protein [Photobacterium chitinilyticum]